MVKVVGMLVALAMFCAMPAVAFAGSSDGDNVGSGNTQTGGIDQGAAGGDSSAGGGGSGSGGSDDGDGDGGGSGGDAGSGDGGDAGNQAAICQQNAGGDANCSIDQSQSFGGDTFVGGDGDGDSDSSGHVNRDHDGVVSVRNVTLARTGFDAWVLALVGGVAIAGGLGLLVAQRRGKLNG